MQDFVISGGGPGIMEAANRRVLRQSPSVGLKSSCQRASRNHYQNISQTFQHFFARKSCLLKFASAYVVMPAVLARLDGTEERDAGADGQDRKMPIILVAEFWAVC